MSERQAEETVECPSTRSARSGPFDPPLLRAVRVEWLPGQDSNLEWGDQKPLCYRLPPPVVRTLTSCTRFIRKRTLMHLPAITFLYPRLYPQPARTPVWHEL